MDILYKYLSEKLDLDQYLKEPTLRISQLVTLNDPFEGRINKKAIGILSEKLCKQIYPDEKWHTLSMLLAEQSIDSIINTYGVISLSETHRNLLMWAHYASEHRGVCIGYKSNVLSSDDLIISESEKLTPYKLVKVNYDDIIFDHEYIDAFQKFDFDQEEQFQKMSMRALTTKSENWSYEKEHRYVVHLELSDKIKFFKPFDSLPESIKKLVNGSVIHGTHKLYKGDKYTQLTSTLRDVEKCGYIYNITSVENKFINNKEAFFLKDIEKSKIASIYFGVESDPSIIEHVIHNVIANDEELKHIRVYKYKLSDERYELVPIQLHPFKKDI
ncbi:DUF2971 domain-containing protein [Aeromonas sp. R2-1]|uniref:DUF2971 domain-containing protein n=1 Tax=Aeromonas sp. R2-1 TaxID=3138459 RepID=UPI0034A16BA3